MQSKYSEGKSFQPPPPPKTRTIGVSIFLTKIKCRIFRTTSSTYLYYFAVFSVLNSVSLQLITNIFIATVVKKKKHLRRNPATVKRTHEVTVSPCLPPFWSRTDHMPCCADKSVKKSVLRCVFSLVLQTRQNLGPRDKKC